MSEYSSGYAVCLRQFLNHRRRLDFFFTAFSGEDVAALAWANGAKDHLYNLTPPATLTDMELSKAGHLHSTMLRMGFGMHPRPATKAACEAELALAEELLAALEMPTQTLDEALAADRALGLDAEVGELTCPVDLDEGAVLGDEFLIHPIEIVEVFSDPRSAGVSPSE